MCRSRGGEKEGDVRGERGIDGRSRRAPRGSGEAEMDGGRLRARGEELASGIPGERAAVPGKPGRERCVQALPFLWPTLPPFETTGSFRSRFSFIVLFLSRVLLVIFRVVLHFATRRRKRRRALVKWR